MLLGASFVPLRAEGKGTPASAGAALLPASLVLLLADGREAPEAPCPDRRAAGKAALLLGTTEALLAEGKGALSSTTVPSAPAAALALAFLPKVGPLFLLSGRCLADAMDGAALPSDSPSWLCAREGAAELKSALPKSLLLRLALGPRAAVLGPMAAGMAPEAEEERERVVRGLGWRAVGPVPWPFALGCSRAVDGLYSTANAFSRKIEQRSRARRFSKEHLASSCCALCPVSAGAMQLLPWHHARAI